MENPQLKIERAWQHLDELERRVRVFAHDNLKVVSAQFDPDQLLYVYRYKAPLQPPPVLGVLVGDIVHNLRSALDQLAWQLALLTTSTPSEKTGFPILKSRNTRRMNEMLRDVPAEARQIIERLQPYHRTGPLEGDQPDWHPLWILHALWNIDKHRYINVLMRNMVTGTQYFVHPRTRPFYSETRRLDNGDIIFEVGVDSETQDQLEPELFFEVVFADEGPAHGLGLVVLNKIYYAIRDRVIPRFAHFFPLDSPDYKAVV